MTCMINKCIILTNVITIATSHISKFWREKGRKPSTSRREDRAYALVMTSFAITYIQRLNKGAYPNSTMLYKAFG